MSGARDVRRGVRFEREVAAMFEDAGFQVRGLEAGGDHFAARADGLQFSVEAKRRERLSVGAWWAQTKQDALPGAVPVLFMRTNQRNKDRPGTVGTGGETLVVLRADDLMGLIGGQS